MCGIVGVISKEGMTNWNTRKKIMEQLIIADTFRGHHSTGMFAVDRNKGRVNAFKRAVPGWDFVDLGRTQEILKDIDTKIFTIAHNRWATKGLITNANAHPFQHRHIVGVHNGHTPSTDFPNGAKFEVDSDALFSAMSELGVEETLERISGAFTLVWYDAEKGSLHVVRNSERPMSFISDTKTKEIYLGSEPQMVKWILERNQIYNYEVHHAEVGLEYIFSLDDPYNFETVRRKIQPPKQYHSWRTTTHTNATTTKSGTTNDTSTRRLPSLSALKISHGQVMDVGPIEFQAYGNNQTAGRVICMQHEKPNHFIVIYGKSEAEFDALEDTIEVKVTGTSLASDGTVMLTSTILEKKEATVLSLPNYLDKSMEGPHDKVTLGRFRELVRDGCGHCSVEIDEKTHKELAWVGDSPICIDCQKLEAFDDDIAY